MKRIALLLLGACATASVGAQSLTLSGTSYTQNFNGLAGGLPSGWHVFLFAKDTSLGIVYDTSSKLFLTPTGASTAWKTTAGGFKNYASANNATAFSPLGTDTTAQNAATDRALGVRQVGYTSTTFPGSDSGAAFCLLLGNTTGLSGFNMSFKLQSLDSATGPRASTWRVDYGIGLLPTSFTTAAATGTLTTGGLTFSNNTITVNFGSALNNVSGPVWIRIVTVKQTTGSGNRTTSAIDDVNLTWTGTALSSPRPTVTPVTPMPNQTGVAATTNLLMAFDKQVVKGSGNIYIKNRNTQVTTTIAASSSSVVIGGGGYLVTVGSLGLQNNMTYHVTMDSTAFDTASYHSYGLYDTTAWKFTTGASGIGSIQTAMLPVTVINPASNGSFVLSCIVTQSAVLTARVYDLNGREVLAQSFKAVKGENRLSLHASLAAGTYIIRVDDGREWGSVKVTMQ